MTQNLTTSVLAVFTVTTLLLGVIAISYTPIALAIHNEGPNIKVCGTKLCKSVNDSDVEQEREKARQKVKKGETGEPPKPQEVKDTMKKSQEVKAEKAPKKDTKAETMEKTPRLMAPQTMTKWDTLNSIQDPGIGHETHQLAVILPPSEKLYRGHLTYSASEPIQLVALTGPLTEDEVTGQPIWTPDGETKFALTFVDQKKAMGTWKFTGNALAVHTMKAEPFSITYSINYMESAPSDNVISGTITSIQDPGIGHETHQLAVILPPSEKLYRGHLTYSASEPIQLVSLIGPLKGDYKKAPAIWTPDGETKFALVLVDEKKSSGSWQFTGNAIAVHTFNDKPFTVSYSAVLEK